MRKTLQALLWVLVLLMAEARAARAAFENLGAGGRDPGMGDAVTGLADDGWAMFYNPAGLAQLERPQFSAAYAQLYTGLSDGSDLGLSQFAYAQPLKNGQNGTMAFAFQRFALSSLYYEQSLYFSYAHQLHAWDSGRKLYWGVNVKYLSHSFSPGAEAANACMNGQCNFGADPVLTGTRSKSVPDADVGFMYRFPQRFQIGLFIEHLMQPDVGFAGADKLPFNARTGVSYKSLWMDLTGDLRYDTAADGSRTKELILGAERYFPTLDYGQFGLRGSLGIGDESWRQLTLGLSYRINKIQIDYGFLMPIGGIATSAGTQRVSLTFHFGAPTAEDEITRELLGKLQQARKSNTPYPYEFGQPPHDLSDPKFADVRQAIMQGRFEQAQARFLDDTKDMKVDDSLIKLGQRLQSAAFYYPDMSGAAEKFDVQTSSALKNFLFGKDRNAMLHDSYALNLQPGSDRLAKLTEKMEQMTQLKAERLPADSPRSFVDELENRVEAAHKVGNRDKERDVLADIHELEPNNLMASERLGSLYFVLGDYKQAIEAWQKAMPLEGNALEVQSMKEYIQQANERLGNKNTPDASLPGSDIPSAALDSTQGQPAAPAMAPAAPAAPAPEAAPAAEGGGDAQSRAAAAVASMRSQSSNDPRQVSDLYQRGVEHYARGEYLQAMAIFMRILQIDPNNAQAQKALERIQERVPSTRAYFQGQEGQQ